MIGNRICAIALAAASTTICFIPPAIAAPFDGNWSVVAQTTQGHCGSMQFALSINRGLLYSGSGYYVFGYPAQLGGRVSPSVCRRTEWLARAAPMPPDASGGFRAAGLGPVAGHLASAQASGMPLPYGKRFDDKKSSCRDKLFAAVCQLGLEGIVSKKLNAPYRSGPSKPG